MNTLDEAWNWYLATRKNLIRMQRIGRKYWRDIAWDTAAVGRDDEFRTLEQSTIERETQDGLAPIDDLAVVVLFSVFESIVRGYLVTQIQPEATGLTHPVLTFAAQEAIRGVEEGSFSLRVLEPLKRQLSPDLIEQVNQVRNYRNWVAHGRRGDPGNNVEPESAFERLQEFLTALGIRATPGTTATELPS